MIPVTYVAATIQLQLSFFIIQQRITSNEKGILFKKRLKSIGSEHEEGLKTAMNSSNPTTVTAQKTLGQYLFDCLKLEGITEIFGDAGEYNFTLLDALEQYNGIRFISGRNELNSGYAADGYARVKGMSALITTFGVEELSACNAIAGANSEHVPLIHIVGAPPEKDQMEHKLMHHTLMNGDFDVFHKVYELITTYTAKLTPEKQRSQN